MHLLNLRLIETWDVLKYQSSSATIATISINRNMRCIEICVESNSMPGIFGLIETWDVLKSGQLAKSACCHCRLIETWDVLKYIQYSFLRSSTQINRNMRCIEIIQNTPESPARFPINRNMRCIEMSPIWQYWDRPCRLIETWDVLKSNKELTEGYKITINRNMRCIEMTFSLLHSPLYQRINRNMRCIEIYSWRYSSVPEKAINRNMRCIEIWVFRPGRRHEND